MGLKTNPIILLFEYQVTPNTLWFGSYLLLIFFHILCLVIMVYYICLNQVRKFKAITI